MIIRPLDAASGDATIVQHVNDAGETILGLIDGGTAPTWVDSIQPALAGLGVTGTGGVLDWLAITHVDSDHLGGALRLVASDVEVRRFYFNTPSPFPSADAITASGTAPPPTLIESMFQDLLRARPPVTEPELASIKQGQDLLDMIVQRGLHNLNPPNNRRLITGDRLDIDGLRMQVVGPSDSRIRALFEEWSRSVNDASPASATRMDTSVTNLSSLTLLLEDRGRVALFTGDALEDDTVAGLEALGYSFPMHVDLLKVSHHGSNSAASPKSIDVGRGLLENVTADFYVISANGVSKNPALETVLRIVQARKPGMRCVIVLPHEPQDDECHDTVSSTVGYYRCVVEQIRAVVDEAGPMVEVRIGKHQLDLS